MSCRRSIRFVVWEVYNWQVSWSLQNLQDLQGRPLPPKGYVSSKNYYEKETLQPLEKP